MSNVKIMVCCHKKTPRINEPYFPAILLGSAFADEELKAEYKDAYWDNTGDNIARLHPYCAELTSIYWIWKNYDKLGNPDYIGLFHYRRFFNFGEQLKEPDLWKCAFFDFEETTRHRFGWYEDNIAEFCSGYDLVLPYQERILDPHDWKTPVNLETHYKHSHYPEDFDLAKKVILETHPEYMDALDRACNSGYGHFCNMFVMTRECFFDYAQWLFDIILPLENLLPVTDPKYNNVAQKRVLGFLGERLFNVWIEYQKVEQQVKIRQTQRLTGYLSEQEQKHVFEQYGMQEYNRLRAAARMLPAKEELVGEDVGNAILYPARITEEPAVSILVPVYNVEPYLRECIESLIHQTLSNIEIVFVDNGSNDGSFEVLMTYYRVDPRIMVIKHKKNEGLPGSRNTALKHAHGRYFGYIDSDDICDLTMFEKLYNKAEQLNADIVTCCVIGFWDNLSNQYYHRPLEWYGNSNQALPLSQRPQQLMEPAAWCKLFRTAYIRSLDYFEFRPGTVSWEDVPAMTSAFIQTDRIATVQEALYYYRQRSTGNLSNGMTRRHTKEFISGARAQDAILKKHHYTDDVVMSYIEEFKYLYTEWILTKMAKKDLPYLFHHVGAIFKLRNRRYLDRLFEAYPQRHLVYCALLTRSSFLYLSCRWVYRFAKRVKASLRWRLDVKREGSYRTFKLGPIRFKQYRKKYSDDTIAWLQNRVWEYEGAYAKLRDEKNNFQSSCNLLETEKQQLMADIAQRDSENSVLLESKQNQEQEISSLKEEKQSLSDKVEVGQQRLSELTQNCTILENTNAALKNANADYQAVSSSLKEANADLLAVNASLKEANADLLAVNASLKDANTALQIVNTSLKDVNADLQAANTTLKEDNSIIRTKNEEQYRSIQSLSEIVERFKQETNGFYRSVWTTGWIDIWKQYYHQHYADIDSRIAALKQDLDEQSAAEVDRLCYRNFILLPRQEDTQYFLYDHLSIYTQEERAGAEHPVDEEYYRNKYQILPGQYLETPVFRFHCGLKCLPQEVVKAMEGTDFIDGGAYWGDSALIFSEYQPKKIYSFEPQPDTFELLKKTIAANNLNSVVTAVKSGLGEASKNAKLYTNGMLSASSLTNIKAVENDEETVVNDIEIQSIDMFAEANNLNVGFIKLDIEGNELAAMNGAIHTIQKFKPVLSISVYHNPRDLFEIKPLIESLNLGYQFMIRKLVYHDLVTEVVLLGYVK